MHLLFVMEKILGEYHRLGENQCLSPLFEAIAFIQFYIDVKIFGKRQVGGIEQFMKTADDIHLKSSHFVAETSDEVRQKKRVWPSFD